MIELGLGEKKEKDGLGIKNECLWIESSEWALDIGSVIEDKEGGINSFDYVIRDRNSGRFFVAMRLKSADTERLEEISLLSIQSKNVSASKCYVISKKDFTKKEKSLAEILLIERVKSIYYDGKEMIVIEDADFKKGYEYSKAKKKESIKKHRRDKSKIMIDILSLTRQEEGVGITKIIYKCNLNYKAAMLFLDEMKQKNLIELSENESKQKRYTITGEGSRTLSELIKLNKSINLD